MTDTLREQFAILPSTLGWHVILSVAAILTGIMLSVPMGVAAVRSRWLAGPVLAAAGVVQTIPSIALLAVMVPLFLLILPDTGARYAIGFWPAYVALVLYSLLPVLRNTVTGLAGVEERYIEAARGMGMTESQVLRRVQIPLAAPTIVAGIRTPVGARCLGDHIFGGLQTQTYSAVVFGCVIAAALAILLDLIIRLFEIAVQRRNRSIAAAAAAMLVLLIGGASAGPVREAFARDSRIEVVVGAKNFTEQYILAEAISQRLGEAGFAVSQRQNLGSTILYEALRGGSVDVYVDYSGTIWTTLMKREQTIGREEMLEEVTQWLKAQDNITCLGRLGFENTYCLAMPRKKAESLGIRTIDDLARHAPSLVIGANVEFWARPEWINLRDTYGLRFAEQKTLEPALAYSAAAGGAVDVVTAFSTDGQLIAHDLVVLEDPRQAFPPYDAILLLGPRAAADPQIVRALSPLIDALPADAMRQANKAVDVDGQSPAAAARGLLPGQ
jgi:osmoprotectant transport system permease protein